MLAGAFLWTGSKQKMMRHIEPIIASIEFDSFVEPFFGSGVVSLNTKAKTYYVNDISKHIVNFFAVLRDNDKRKELIKLLELTPYAEDEFYFCRDNLKESCDQIERARRFFVSRQLSMFGAGTSFYVTEFKNSVTKMQNKIQQLHIVAEIIKTFHICNKDAFDFLKLFNDKNTLIYCDPPYPETVNKYNTKAFTIKDFERLLQVLAGKQCKAIVSSYKMECIIPRCFEVKTFKTRCQSTAFTNGDHERIECLYIKRY